MAGKKVILFKKGNSKISATKDAHTLETKRDRESIRNYLLDFVQRYHCSMTYVKTGIEKLNTQVQEFENCSSEKHKILHLDSDLESLSADILAARESLAAKKKEISEHEREIETITENAKSLETRKRNYRATITSLKQDINNKNFFISDLEVKLNSLEGKKVKLINEKNYLLRGLEVRTKLCEGIIAHIKSKCEELQRLSGLTVNFVIEHIDGFSNELRLLLTSLHSNLSSLIDLCQYQLVDSENSAQPLDEFQDAVLSKNKETAIEEIEVYIKNDENEARLRLNIINVLYDDISTEDSQPLIFKLNFLLGTWLGKYLFSIDIVSCGSGTLRKLHEIAKKIDQADRMEATLMSAISSRMINLNEKVDDYSLVILTATRSLPLFSTSHFALACNLLKNNFEIMSFCRDNMTVALLYVSCLSGFSHALERHLITMFRRNALCEYVLDSKTQSELCDMVLGHAIFLSLRWVLSHITFFLINVAFSESDLKDNVIYISNFALLLNILYRSMQIFMSEPNNKLRKKEFRQLMIARHEVVQLYLKLESLSNTKYKVNKENKKVYYSFIVLNLMHFGGWLMLSDGCFYLASLFFGDSFTLSQDSHDVLRQQQNVALLCAVFVLMGVVSSHVTCDYAISVDSINHAYKSRLMFRQSKEETQSIGQDPVLEKESKLNLS